MGSIRATPNLPSYGAISAFSHAFRSHPAFQMRFGRRGNAGMIVSIIPNVKDYPMR